MTVSAQPMAGSRFVVVRRGEAEVFESFLHARDELGLGYVLLDRRLGERRSAAEADPRGPERRQGERRGRPPAIWDELGFMLAWAANGP
jgi:hypothetical protein